MDAILKNCFLLFSKCVAEASNAWKLKKPIIPLRMETDFKPVDWLETILGTKLYINMCSDDEMTKNMKALIKAIGNRGRKSCDEVDGMQSNVIYQRQRIQKLTHFLNRAMSQTINYIWLVS